MTSQEITRFTPYQLAALPQWCPYTHFAMLCGVAVGKTFTGAHFAIWHIMTKPHLTGFIGANTYDQLNQATMRELLYWLDTYGIEYVVDRTPPKEWKAKRFKKYQNIITTYYRGKPTTIFTRVLLKGNPLRGMEFSWYWIDETRDTPMNTHDIILSRLRESEYIKGLVTTTTAGEDWCYKRFTKNVKKDDFTYGSLHVETKMSVKYGIITEKFYRDLLASYDEMTALQELFAKHVNAIAGRAYFAAGDSNCLQTAPWGDEYPDPSRPLIIGCDFNFAPAPCIWMVGQVGPDMPHPEHEDLYYSDCIHWFAQIRGTQVSTPDLVKQLVGQFGVDFFYQIYGDASGNRGTTSNAGESDYIQMANTFDDLGCDYSIDVDQANPKVKDRVTSMNAMLKNALGQSRMTYNPDQCPDFHSDMNVVGWKPNISGTQKLDDCGDYERTHASDGGGYAIYKLFPIGKRARIIESLPSALRQDEYNRF